MVNPSSSSRLRPCSSKKRKRKSNIETELEESRISLIRPCSTNETLSITADVEEDKEEKKNQNIDGACKRIRDGCDFLCAEELGKEFLICGGGGYHSKKNQKEVSVSVSIKKVVHKKSVGILFVNLTSYNELYFLRPLTEVYYQLKQQRGAAFEIVFVATFPSKEDDGDDDNARKELLFNAHLKQMPWLAVPFADDKNWRKHLLKRYNQESKFDSNDLIFFDPNGRLLEHYGDGLEKLINFFGPDFYPFTNSKEKELIVKYFAPLRSPNKSLEALLGRDFLISSSGDGDGDGDYKKVPISQLQGKVVGIYFFHEEQEKYPIDDFMRTLEDFRLRASSERGSSFEIVFINVDFEFGYSSETSFYSFLKKWPWLLALPFKDDKIRALCYSLAIGDCINNLVIVGGGGGDEFFIDPHGYNIIQEYGFDAYPFTRDMAIATAKKRLTQLTIADFLKATGTEFLRRCKGKPDKPVSFLQNKRVLLYIANTISGREIRKLLDLQKKDKSFEVLFFGGGRRTLNAMPQKWVAFPPDVYLWELIDKLIKINIEYCNYFIAFDDTGKLIKMGDMKLLKKKDGAAAFPFITDETFENDFRQMMIHTKEWNYEVGEWNYEVGDELND